MLSNAPKTCTLPWRQQEPSQNVKNKKMNKDIGSSAPQTTPSKFAKEIEIQTETHPVESFIDPKYEFSQWQLRKNVLRMADLRNKKDDKTQTVESHFRRDNDAQVYLKKYVFSLRFKVTLQLFNLMEPIL